MAVSLSIKEVPDDVAVELRARATRNRRSLQGELLHILETATARPRPFDAKALVRELQALGVKSRTSSVAMIRRMRAER